MKHISPARALTSLVRHKRVALADLSSSAVDNLFGPILTDKTAERRTW